MSDGNGNYIRIPFWLNTVVVSSFATISIIFGGWIVATVSRHEVNIALINNKLVLLEKEQEEINKKLNKIEIIIQHNTETIEDNHKMLQKLTKE